MEHLMTLEKCAIAGCTNHRDLLIEESRMCRECLVHSIMTLSFVARQQNLSFQEVELVVTDVTETRLEPWVLDIRRTYQILMKHQDNLIAAENNHFMTHGYDPSNYKRE